MKELNQNELQMVSGGGNPTAELMGYALTQTAKYLAIEVITIGCVAVAGAFGLGVAFSKYFSSSD
jgi:bacteriocin-like protein